MIILGVRNFRVFEILEHLPYLVTINSPLIHSNNKCPDQPVHGQSSRVYVSRKCIKKNSRGSNICYSGGGGGGGGGGGVKLFSRGVESNC